MFANELNEVRLMGNVGRDPESKNVSGDNVVSKFSLATTRSWKPQGASEWSKETTWHNIEVWGKKGIVDRISKGSLVFVAGRIKVDKYTDKNGQEKTAVKIVAEDLCVIESSGVSGGSSASQTRQSSQKSSAPSDDWAMTDEEVPF
ncbi:MAG: single-stranded DNA-binding protein [Candidatus Competibacteraceae bacterium]|nr:single-stranded DNA-binding protein [Candidatus Competibacteraceae bacterium]